MYNIENYLLKYVDEDKDEVTIASDEELSQAFDTAQNNLLRLYVKSPPASQSVLDIEKIGDSFNFDKSMPNLGEVLTNPLIDMISSSVLSQIRPHLDRFRDASQILSASFINNLNNNNFPPQGIPDNFAFQAGEKAPEVRELLVDIPKPENNNNNNNNNSNNNNNNDKNEDNNVVTREEVIIVSDPEIKECINYSCKYVRDITIKDLTQIEEGSKVTKEWLLLNDGNAQWPEGTTIKLISGDSSVALDGVLSYPVPLAKPGDEVSVQFPLQAPSPGRYTTYFRLMLPQGNPMPGSRFWTDIISTPASKQIPLRPLVPSQPVPIPVQPVQPIHRVPVQPVQPVPQPAPQPVQRPVELEIPPAYRDGVNCLVSMGFDQAKALNALKQGNGDIMRAIDLLS